MKPLLLTFLSICLYCSVFANITQSKWRWRNDDGNEKNATWKAAENTAITVNDFNTFRLRLSIYNANAEVKSFSRNLQYATSASGPWYTLSDATPIQAFVISSSSNISNGQSTTQQLTASQYSFVPGSTFTDADIYNDNIQPSTSSEYEWCMKATQYAQPQTTYYFKAAEGDAPAVIPSVTTGNAFTAKKTILTNGSFEQNLSGWQTAARNGSSANFSVVKTTNHSGANTLKATVNSLSKYNSTGIGHTPFKVNKEGYYLLRFWAVADKRNALLTLNIKTSKGNDTCFFKIYDRFDKAANQWQMYQYAFKAPAGNVSVQMGLNTVTTYYIDDVEVLDESTTEDAITQYNWQNNQKGYGWLSGDNDNSVLLPDSSVAWIFSDSFTGLPLPHSNVIGGAPILNNLIVHEKNNQFTSVYGGTQSSPRALFSPGNGNIFWNSGGTVEGNNLRVMLIEIGGGSSYTNTAYVGTLSLPDLKVTGQVKTSYNGPNAPNTIFTDGNYHYIYISERAGTFENYSQVARVQVGQLSSSTTKWQFYTNNNTWSTDYTQAKRIIAGVEAASVVKLGENNYALSGVPNLSNEVAVWFAQSPVGPWVNKTVLYYIPAEEGMLPYQGHIDKGSGKNGDYILSYSVYPFSGLVPQQLSDKGSYIPYYIKANLPALSPFTNAAKHAKEKSAVAKEDVSKLPSVVVVQNPATQADIQFQVKNIKGAFAATLTDMNGKQVASQQFNNVTSSVYHLNLNKNVSAGTYFLKVAKGNISANAKVIVQ